MHHGLKASDIHSISLTVTTINSKPHVKVIINNYILVFFTDQELSGYDIIDQVLNALTKKYNPRENYLPDSH